MKKALLMLSLALLGSGVGSALAQNYPTRPIRLVVFDYVELAGACAVDALEHAA